MQYDRDLVGLGSVGPEVVASKLASLVAAGEARRNLRVLDVAAGTGRVGEALHRAGFRNVEALGEAGLG